MSENTIKILIEIGYVALILVIGAIAIKVIINLTERALKKTRLDEALHTFIKSALKIVLWIILMIVLLGYLNISSAPFITVLGVCGAAMALALKDSLGNISGGVLILINKPFSKGDGIEVAGAVGMVEKIDLLVTTLKTYDNKVVLIPNGTINTSIITNYSRENTRRVDLTFGISYESDIANAKQILLSMAENNPKVLKEPELILGVADYINGAAVIDFKVWCKTNDYFDVKYSLEENVKVAFDAAGISIPRTQMDVHLIK